MAQHYSHITLPNMPIYALGDMHGAISVLKQEINNNNVTDCCLVICGDIGLGFSSRKSHLLAYQDLNAFLRKKNIILIVFRGNHDDARYFNREVNLEEVDDDNFCFSNVKVVPDYTVLTINNTNILIVGGATSIDRIYRKQNDEQRILALLEFYPKSNREDIESTMCRSYWENEKPIFNTDALDEITKDGIVIEHVLTHTCPPFAFPTTKDGVKGWLMYDKNLTFDLDHERCVMDNIYHYLLDSNHPLKSWTYGHYHSHYQEEIDNVLFTTLSSTDMKFDAHEIVRIED